MFYLVIIIINLILNIAVFLDEFTRKMISYLACVLYLTNGNSISRYLL